MNKILCALLAISAALLVSSCCKDDCNYTSQYEVKIFVGDKNYSNIDKFPQLQKEDETLPFSHFLSTVYYELKNKGNGNVIKKSFIDNITGNSSYYSIILSDIPKGEYELSVWGNLVSGDLAGVLHKEGVENRDIYTGNVTLSSAWENRTNDINLLRTKGKLLVLCNNFPPDIEFMRADIESIYGMVDFHLNYSSNAKEEKKSPFTSINEYFTAPSSSPSGNVNLDIEFYYYIDAPSSIIVPKMELPVQRNEISAVLIDYNKLERALEIWVYIKGEWTLIHYLETDLLIN